VPWTIPTLLSIGTDDEAVSVSDATRWALQIRQARAPETPVLLQIEEGAGHLGATNASDRSRFEAQRLATVLSFANLHRSRDEG
jgi:protease II